MGDSEERLISQAKAQRGPIPQKILNAPELYIGLDFVYASFHKLSTHRSMGFGASGPIPWHVVDDFCKKHQMDEDDQSDIEYLISKMDAAYLKYMTKLNEKKAEYNRQTTEARQPLNAKLAAKRR